MSQLVSFYRGEGTDSEGRLLSEIWAWNDDSLEAIHDFIQWLFPLPEPSRFNPDAPLLTLQDIEAFQKDPLIQANLRKSFERIIAFLGLAEVDGKIVEGPTFGRRVPFIWAALNHNWLRITRILRSLHLLGRQAEADALYERLAEFHRARRFPIPADTFGYWASAVGR